MRIVPTPIATPAAWPSPMPGGFDPALAPAIIAGPGQESLRARLAEPDVLVVTTGQQPALFTGPLYAVHKALSAAALAQVLSARWGRSVVPLFWVAGDDHDFAEANHAAWLRPDGSLHVETLPDRPPEAALRPMSREPLGAGIEPALSALTADLAALEGHPEVLQWLRAHFRPESTLAAASGAALAELLAPLGVLCLDGSHDALKARGAPVLRRALEDASGLEAALVQRAAVLAAAGRNPGVPVGDGATLVMVEGREGRDRLVVTGAGFRTRHGGERYTREEVLGLLEREPGRFSGNVLLRPVLERFVLPTVAYVAGPGELRYLALAAAVYAHLGVSPQLPVPRWSGLLVEPRVDRVLAKFGASLEELLAPAAQLESRVARERLPAEAMEAITALRSSIERQYDAIEAAAVDIDPTLQRPIRGLKGRALQGAGRAEEKLVRHLKRRYETDTTQIERARTALLPGGRPQERVLTVAPFLARYGHGILPALLAEMVAWYGSALEGGAPPS
ncbi:MAG TPA: bacillithiol biosynthesis cysteine-adding enzyme BshC [Gemmatimonadales bacterium]|nr:bacillithiol biosynthesis cysteine-adding enzyme BshC [Gemmatimonadales bacterium]HRZ10647.1 bacillithiol biosynthesis cysteine-adding enzyme BshC [Gemmatimonadales bacterium]